MRVGKEVRMDGRSMEHDANRYDDESAYTFRPSKRFFFFRADDDTI